MTEEKLLYLGTWKGRVIKAIAVDGAKTWNEIREKTGLNPKSLNIVLRELFNAKAIEHVKNNEGKTIGYRVEYNLYKLYDKYYKTEKEDKKVPIIKIAENVQKELRQWIDNWKEAKRLDFSLAKDHFYLEGRFLTDFSQEIIANAKNEVLIVNPWLNECDLSKTLRDAIKNKASVTVVRRPIEGDSNKNFISLLEKDGIIFYDNPKVHAKIVVVDRAVAITSSMNFTVQSSGGQSWEAGLITVDHAVVENIVNSILNLIEMYQS